MNNLITLVWGGGEGEGRGGGGDREVGGVKEREGRMEDKKEKR